MASPTPNKGMTYPAHGGAVNAWDTPLNADFDIMDLVTGGNYPIVISSTIAAATYNASGATIPATAAAITFPTTNALNLSYTITGGLTNAMSLVFPSVGGFYDVFNNSSNSFSITAQTASVGRTKIVGQGSHTFLIADSVNMDQADDSATARLQTFLGNPNGNVAGNAGASNGSLTDVEWDGTNKQLFAATTTGVSTTAVWQVIGPVLPDPQGYLTPTSGTPIITADAIGSTVVYLYPLNGPWQVACNGVAPYPFQTNNQLTLALASTAVATGGIYDVFFTANSTAGSSVGILGTGPSWAVGGGSVGAGSGARGNGAGSTQLSQNAGFLVNTNSITLANGSSAAFTISSGAAVWIGSLYCSSASGTVTLHRSYGQNRVWGISNGYNRTNVFLKGGDPTSSWAYGSTAWRVANNSTANSLVIFNGQPQEIYSLGTKQNVNVGNASGFFAQTAVGFNSTNTPSGYAGYFGGNSGTNQFGSISGEFITSPSLGINIIYSLENTGPGATGTFFGSETNMLLNARWKA